MKMNTNYKITIPEMTHPLSKHWDQPAANKITLTDIRAVMNNESFKALAEYSCTIPSGVYAGKMWKRLSCDQWYLCWYEDHPTLENRCSIKEKIIFLEE